MSDSHGDWRREALSKLAKAKFSVDEREEIACELAGYLEDVCADANTRGGQGSFERRSAAAELDEDKDLGANLYRARKETPIYLNDRTKRLWFPALALFIASAALLAIFQIGALWVYHAYAPTPHAQNYHQLVFNLMKYRSAALLIYLAWVFTLPFLAAGGVQWSRRAGSERSTQIAAGLFPMLLFLAMFTGQWIAFRRDTLAPFLGMGSLPPAHLFFFPFVSVSFNLVLSWIVIPGAALLLGVLPFLFEGARGSEAA